MSTNSTIARYDPVGDKFFSVYCHWDGYPSHNGAILLEHYNSEEKIEALLEYGSISGLGETLEECKFHSRDMAEELEHPIESDTEQDLIDVGKDNGTYTYLFRNGKWEILMYGDGQFRPMTAELVLND